MNAKSEAVDAPAVDDPPELSPEERAMLIESWINTRMERDRSLLTLASAGIGLLVSVLAIAGQPKSTFIPLYFVAFAAFLTTVISIVLIFNRNAVYIRRLLMDGPGRDPLLTVLDRIAGYSFLLGVTSFVGLGFLALILRP